MKIKTFMYKKYWFLLGLLIIIDLLFVILHFVYGQDSFLFNLDHEKNLPTIYQGIKMFSLGILLLIPAWKNKHLNFLIPLAIIFSYIGIDEALQLHERAEYLIHALIPETAASLETTAEHAGFRSSRWLLYFIPVIMIVYSYFALVWYRILNKIHGLIIPYSVTLLLFFVVIYLEFINSQGIHTPQEYQRLMVAEEFAEMLSASVLLPFVFSIYTGLK